MSEMKHTPGPWRTNGCYISSNYGEVGHAYWVSSMPDGMSEANARLIAAAPELLEALQAIIDGPGLDCVPDNDVQALISSAIAKATGAPQ